MTQHIFLTGKKHIGKSTLIQKILDDYKKTSDGFLTVRTKNYLKDQYSVHMYHLKEKELPNKSNLLFLCGKTDEHTADTFDRLGCNILSMCWLFYIYLLNQTSWHIMMVHYHNTNRICLNIFFPSHFICNIL